MKGSPGIIDAVKNDQNINTSINTLITDLTKLKQLPTVLLLMETHSFSLNHDNLYTRAILLQTVGRRMDCVKSLEESLRQNWNILERERARLEQFLYELYREEGAAEMAKQYLERQSQTNSIPTTHM